MSSRPKRLASQCATRLLFGIVKDEDDQSSESEASNESEESSLSNLSPESPADNRDSDFSSNVGLVSSDESVTQNGQFVSKDGLEQWSVDPIIPTSGKERRQNVLTQNVGPTRQSLERCDDPESAFSLFITNEMLENICKYTKKGDKSKVIKTLQFQN